MKQQTIYNMWAGMLLMLGIAWVQLATSGASAQINPTPSPSLDDVLELARDFSGSNADWTPISREFNGVEMVLVPAGCFEMGSESGSGNELPVHRVCFEEPFWIDHTDVTNGQFKAHSGQAAQEPFFSSEDRPRDQITWTEAAAFCESRGGRLPTEAEWEYVARGPDNLEYPWGNEWMRSRVISERTPDKEGKVVYSFADGASWVGALDMSGPLWEWIADWYDAGYYWTLANDVINPVGPASGEYRVARWGAWSLGLANYFHAASRSWAEPDSWNYNVGFRCARDS